MPQKTTEQAEERLTRCTTSKTLELAAQSACRPVTVPSWRESGFANIAPKHKEGHHTQDELWRNGLDVGGKTPRLDVEGFRHGGCVDAQLPTSGDGHVVGANTG